MKVLFRYLLSAFALLVVGNVRAQEFNPEDPPEPMTQRMVRIIAEPAEGVSSITTGGYHLVGETVNVQVTTNSAYDFLYWTLNGRNHSGNTSFSYTVGDSVATFIAVLQKKPVVSVSVSPSGAGNVSGGGAYSPGASPTISTVGNSGYTFLYWMLNGAYYSNNTSVNYTVGEEDASFVAVYQLIPEPPFNPDNPLEPMANYYVSVQTNLPEGIQPASITESGYHFNGDPLTISVSEPEAYQFEYWTRNGQHYKDDNSFNFEVGTSNEVFVAHFAAKPRVTVSCTPAEAATNSGGGYYVSQTKILLSTTPNDGYKFLYWALDEMRYSESPAFYYIVGSQNVNFVAVYEIDDDFNPDSPYEEPFIPSNPSEPEAENTALLITVLVNDTLLGSVSGLPTTPLFADDEITLTATPSCEGYYFSHWENNSTSNPRTITLTGDAIYVAHFAKRQYIVTFYDEDGSTIVDQREWSYGDIPTCASPAKADDGHYSYRFDKWQPNVVVVTQEASYMATYEATSLHPVDPTDLNEADATVTIRKFLRDGQIFILRAEKVYTLQGQEVK